jgi:hypothetical protein
MKTFEFADFSVHIKLLRFPQKTYFFLSFCLPPEKVNAYRLSPVSLFTLWQFYAAPLSARERQERQERRTKATTKKIAHTAMAT